MKTTLALLFFLAAQAPASWLDRPLSNWNAQGRAVERSATSAEEIADTAKRCAMPIRPATPAERVLGESGWLPFHMFDKAIAERDIEIVGGLSDADGMCRPTGFNVFVFVGGTFAGTLSPVTMDSRSDGTVAGGIRLSADDAIAAEFARYTDKDALCCPSARVRFRYTIDRSGTTPVVFPVSEHPIRLFPSLGGLSG
jgi:hypothetical protein